MAYKKVNENSPMAQIELLIGAYGSSCISINGTRVTSGKLYGFGHCVSCCHTNKDRIRKLIDGKAVVHICFVNCGRGGIWVDGVNISTKGKKSDYEKYIEHRNELLKKCRKKYHPKLLKELRGMNYWKVETKHIEDTLNDFYYYVERI